jgi:integrase
MESKGIKDYEELIKPEPSDIQDSIISFIVGEKKKVKSAITLNGYINALKHFFDMNDIEGIKWKKIRRFKGEYVRAANDVPYTTEQIKHLLTFCDVRKKVILLLMASSGVRIGAIHTLSIGDFVPVHEGKLYQITVYRGTKQQYVTFCSSECKQAIDEYLEKRKRFGEVITPQSPLIRDVFQQEVADSAKDVIRVSDSQVKAIVFRLLIEAGLRKLKGDGSRKDVMAAHGFRKFFKSTARRAGVDPLILELFMGHLSGGGVVSKLQMIYEGNQHDEKELLEQYTKAHNDLTIHSQHRLEMKLKEAEQRLAKEDAIMEKIREMEAKFFAQKQ